MPVPVQFREKFSAWFRCLSPQASPATPSDQTDSNHANVR